VATLAFIPSAYTSPAGVLARQRPGRAQALSGTPGVVAETAHQRHFRKRSAEVRALLAISAPTGAPSSEFWLDRVLAGLPEVQERVVTRRACMVHAWLVVCTRSGSRRRSSFRPRFAASPAHPGGCPTCAGRAAAVRPALRGHAGLWAGLAAKPAPFVWATLGLYASEQGGAKRGQVPRANKGWVAPQTEWGGGNHGSSQPGGLDPSAGFCQVSQGRPSTAATTELTRY
jgi:hypothetical protein